MAASKIFKADAVTSPNVLACHLSKALSSRRAIFNYILYNTDACSNFTTHIIKTLRQHIHDKTLPMIIQSGISFEQYKRIRKCLDFCSLNGKRVQFTINDIPMKLFKGKDTVAHEYHTLLTKYLTLQPIDAPTFTGWERPLQEIIDFQFQYLYNFMTFKEKDKIHLSVRIDAFPIAKGQALCILYSLEEFQVYSKLPLFQRIGNIAYVGDKEYENIILAWGNNLNHLLKLNEKGTIWIESQQRSFEVQISFCLIKQDKGWCLD